MKLVAKLAYSTFAVFPADQAGVIVPALSTGVMYNEEGYGANKKYAVREDEPVEFTFVADDKFAERPEVLVSLQKSRDESEKRWLEEYSKHNETKKELAAAKSKLESITSAASA